VTTAATAFGILPFRSVVAETRLRAAIIGHTGRGDYGHGLDAVFNGRGNIEVVAVADPEASGRKKAAAAANSARQYDDYRAMLEKERPDLVSIGPRWTDQHHAMGMAALKAGAHIYLEKPFTQTLAEADELLAIAETAGLKIAVAHQGRLAPGVLRLKELLNSGFIGELLEIRVHGKQDKRAGGEDMVVLGTHQFDLVRFFAGDAQWCSARILQDGREATMADARKATEDIGPVIGNEITAQFGMSGGVLVNYTSRARYVGIAGPMGMELLGSKGVVRMNSGFTPDFFQLKQGAWSASGQASEWKRLDDAAFSPPPAESTVARSNQRVVDDWLAAIRDNREPACSGRAAMKSYEMIMTVFQAGLTRTRVGLPMKLRTHPLTLKA
jgi:predicted dehydrogenase